jgi:hypothetical protein
MAMMAFSRHPPPPAVVESRLAPYVIDAARVMSKLAPRELRDGVAASYEKIKRAWKQAVEKLPERPPAQTL